MGRVATVGGVCSHSLGGVATVRDRPYRDYYVGGSFRPLRELEMVTTFQGLQRAQKRTLREEQPPTTTAKKRWPIPMSRCLVLGSQSD